MTRPELLTHRPFLHHIARQLHVPTRILEVGVREGDSLQAMLTGACCVRAVLVDTWGPHHGGTGRGNGNHVLPILREAKVRTELQGLSMSSRILSLPSHTALPQLLRDGEAFDLTHIDGDHSYAGAVGDLRLAWPLTTTVLVVHDLFMGPVLDAIRIFLQEEQATVQATNLSLMDNGSLAIWRRQ
jgi:hypothetical protein